MRKGGLRRKYFLSMVLIILFFILIIGGTYVYINDKYSNLAEARQEVSEKAIAMDHLANSVNGVFFRARGYYAFKIDTELKAAYTEIEKTRSAIQQLRKSKLNKDESDLVDELDTFLNRYEEVTLPYAVSLVNANDYEGLRELSLAGANASVNKFIDYANEYNEQLNRDLFATFDDLTEQLNSFYLFILGGSLILLVIIISFIQKVIHNIIRPIEQIKKAADSYQNGKIFDFQHTDRADEIGALSLSFSGMIKTIWATEEELTAQNEELQMQQEDLIDKQAKMEYALSEARYTKIRLERYNGLNNKLSFSMDEQELLDMSLRYLDELYGLDIANLWLPENGKHSIKGISEEMFTQFTENQSSYIKSRLAEEPHFIIKREADYEKGISTTSTYVYDFFVGIQNSDGEITLIVALSRIGRSFTNEDQEDINSLVKRVALAVERVEQYDTINRERILTQHILDNINEGIYFISADGEHDRYNKTLLELFDISIDSADKREIRDILREAIWMKAPEQGNLAEFISKSVGAEIHSEISYEFSNGASKVITVYSVPVIMNGKKAGTIFVHRDITVEHEIDHMKTELVSTVSHELRTPLTSVLGFTELLLSKTMEPHRQKRYLHTIHKEAKRLTNLINDFLDLQRMESGKQTYELLDINISEVAKEAADAIQVGELHSISIIDKAVKPTVIADRDKITQLFTNILSNALKFSTDGGNVLITLETEEDKILVSIADEGIGIPAAQAGKMFEKFQRFDNSYSRKIGGTGLGLAICREVVEKHSGRIWIESEENTGTTVFFSLPLKIAVKTENLSSSSPAVMIVEDDSSIALLLGEELKTKGFSIVHQSKVEPAMAYAIANQPACIVVDLLLGEEQTGWDLIKQLKEEPQTHSIPIVISSALEEQKELVEQFKVDSYMTKPYPVHELSKTISHALYKNDGVILYPTI